MFLPGIYISIEVIYAGMAYTIVISMVGALVYKRGLPTELKVFGWTFYFKKPSVPEVASPVISPQTTSASEKTQTDRPDPPASLKMPIAMPALTCSSEMNTGWSVIEIMPCME